MPMQADNDLVVTAPAIVWRWGSVGRGVTVGIGVGLFFGALAWLDSGMPAAGAVVLVVLSIGYGVWIARRMLRYWPGSKHLTGEQREAVVSAVRSGSGIDDPTLAPGVLEYCRALHLAAEKGRPWRWVVVFLLVVAVSTALWDAAFGSVGNGVASAVYLVLAALELFWWPKQLAELLANADRAARLARSIDVAD